MEINSFAQAKQFLYRYIPKGVKQKFPGPLGLKRTKYFLKLLGNPQNRLKIIHIAGTSGKGSTAYLTGIILNTLGFRVGLHISPHLIDIRERFQINNQLVKKEEFCFYLNKLIPHITKVTKSKLGVPTYFEILVALAFLIFFEKKVDYAVVETGVGGLYDATNVAESKNKLVILTKMGFDHTKILGKSLDKIAFQKAMIIKKKNPVVSIWQKPSARKIIEKIAKENQTKLYFFKKTDNFRNIKIIPSKTVFDFRFLKFRFNKLELGLTGFFQAENCSLALAAVLLLSQRDKFLADEKKMRQAIQQTSLPGRMQIIKIKNKTVVIDGAHNPQKMSNFTKSIKKMYPKKKFDFLIAIKKGKDYSHILRYVTPLAHKIIVTSFSVDDQDLIHFSEKPEELIRSLEKQNFHNYLIIKDPQQALRIILKRGNKSIIITGSLYLIGELYPTLKKLIKF